MSVGDARNHIYTRFIAQWADRTPFQLDNEKFEIPSTGPWVRLVVRNTLGEQDTLGRAGNRKFLRNGLIAAQVFTEASTGTAQGDTLAEAVRDIFEGESFNGILANNGTITELDQQDGRWYQHNVSVAFFVEQIK